MNNILAFFFHVLIDRLIERDKSSPPLNIKAYDIAHCLILYPLLINGTHVVDAHNSICHFPREEIN